MKTIIRRRAWHRASEGLSEYIASCQASGISHLPSVRTLADMFKVSPVTMGQVLGDFASRGLVIVRGRIGAYIAEPGRAPADAVERRTAIEPSVSSSTPLHRRIAEDLHAGRFRQDQPLPSFKELRVRYHASYAALRAVLDTLAGSGVLERHGRAYVISRPHARRPDDTIVVIARSNDWSSLCTSTPRAPEFWRVLEQECQRTNISLTLWHCSDAVRRFKSSSAANPEIRGTVLGYLVLSLGLSANELHQLGVGIRSRNAPVAFLDEVGSQPVPMAIQRNPLARYYSMAYSPLAGRIVGAHLLAGGHRSVAFLCPVSDCPWLDARGDGLEEVYRAAGLPDAVTRLPTHDRINPATIGSTITQSRPYRDLVRHRQRFSRHFGPQSLFMERRFYDVAARELFDTQIWAGALEPTFTHALRNLSCTAWVGVNDSTALLAMEFLERHRVNVPAGISVVGFDDSPQALARGLTSYNYNVSSVTRAMVDHVLRPGSSLSLATEFPQEIPGTVVTRRSSGQLRPGA